MEEEPAMPVAVDENDKADPPAAGDDDILAWLSVDADTLEELMKVLDNDINHQQPHGDIFPFNNDDNSNRSKHGTSSSNCMKVRFIENPYSATLVFQSSSSYITINGNEETCGSSFSDWEASVMASVDVGSNVGPMGCPPGQLDGGAEECFGWEELLAGRVEL